MKRLHASVLIAVLLLGACAPPPAKQGRVGGQTFVFPERPDIPLVLGGDGDMAVELCNLKVDPAALSDGCVHPDPALAGGRGFYVILRNRTASSVFAERSSSPVAPLVAKPLAAAPVDENRALRLRLLGSPIYTTDAGWPLAGCVSNLNGDAQCVLGFAIGQAEVEASWANRGGPPTQDQLWRIGSGLDAKLRSFIKP